MGRELNIDSDQAYEIANTLADKLGKSVTEVVVDALKLYGIGGETPGETQARWDKLLKEDRRHLNASDFEVNDFYDPETGLPA